MSDDQNHEKPRVSRPRINPRSYSLNVVFLLVTVCAVIAGMIGSAVQGVRGSMIPGASELVTIFFCCLIGLIVGIVVGAHREPKGPSIGVGIPVGMLSGGVAAAFILLPPTPAMLLVGCVVLIMTAALMRSVQR